MNVKEAQVIIGIDVSKDKLDIYDSSTQKHIIIENTVRSIGQWLTRIKKQYSQCKVVFEPTGGYEKKLINALLSKGAIAYNVHPNKLFNFKKCHGDKAKTDKIDAMFIAQYAQAHPDQLKEIKSDYTQNKRISELSKAREQIKNQLHAVNCFLEHEPYDRAIKQHYKRLKKFLIQELKCIEQRMDESIKNDENMQRTVELLTSIVGVGKVTAQAMVTDVPELGKLDKAVICKLVGVAPINQDSGKQQGQRCIQGGRAQVRAKLYMAALTAIRYNPRMKQIYANLKARGKPFKVAMVAIMRKMLCIMNAIVRDNTLWQHNNELVVQKA